MLGLLANFEKDESYDAIWSIVESINAITKGDLAKSRYFEQLRILVKLRNSIEPQFEKAMESISTFFKIEDDIWYRKGEAQGEAQGEAKGEAQKSHTVVENCIARGFNDELIAEIAEVETDFVQKVRAELQKVQ